MKEMKEKKKNVANFMIANEMKDTRNEGDGY